MSNQRNIPPEIWALMNRVTDKVATTNDVRRLADWLGNRADRQDLFLDYCEMHVQLSLDAGMDRVRSKVLDCLRNQPMAPVFPSDQVAETLASNSPSPGLSLGSPSLLLPVLGVLALSCVLIVGSIVGWGKREVDQQVAPVVAEQVALVTDAVDATWVTLRPQSLPTVVRAGDLLEVSSGLVELRFTSGATVIMKGPARLRALSPSKVSADRGCITARVEDAKIGFVVETPNAKVVDLGTEFGVDVTESGETNVVVLDGAVDVVTDEAKQTNRLTKGEGIKAGSSGSLERIVSIRSEDFPTTTTVPVRTRPPLVKSIKDNLRSLNSKKFYEIAWGGIAEDVHAYVDRPYEWNGVDKSGIPEFLLGADYVKTFNSDKSQPNIEISIELAEAAELYLFVDDRSEQPDWLKKDFIDTGADIGIDEAPYLEYGKGCQIGIGPGESIDHVFSIWRRRVSEPGVVTLGSIRLHDGDPGISMYGIAATPVRAPKKTESATLDRAR